MLYAGFEPGTGFLFSRLEGMVIGNKYWSTGIIIDYNQYGELWSAKAKFYDDGWCQDESTEGEIRARYWSKDLPVLLDNVKADVEKLDIEWKDGGQVFAKQDGESFPTNWKETLKTQADRLGFTFPYMEVENV